MILVTSKPVGMYHDSVYPISRLGTSNMAFGAGTISRNLTEWQFGTASLRPRWNVNGTYMQIFPTFVPTDTGGEDEKEFFLDHFETPREMPSLISLGGYQ